MENQSDKTGDSKRKIIATVLSIAIISTSTFFICAFALDKSSNIIKSEPDVVTVAADDGKKFVINANNQFAFDLYPEVDNGSNLFFSPYSISSAMAMVYSGAKGKTADEIKSVLYFPDNNTLKYSYAEILNDLNKQNNNYELKTANALWVQKNYKLLPDYNQSASKYYGAKITNLDFANDGQQSAKTINDYVSEQTNNKIKDIVGNLDGNTKLILTNAIYFKSDWLIEFNKSRTTKQNFKVTPTKTVKTDMMGQYGERFNYFGDDNLQIIELPYKNNRLSMLVMLPKNNLDSIKSILTASKLDEYKSKMSNTEISELRIPKVKFETDYDLAKNLKSLGIKSVFSKNADLSGINGKKGLFVSEIKHKAYVDIDEQGTEAAAATAITVSDGYSGAAKPDTIDFIADHPYVFLIQDNKSGNILFLGKVSSPTNLTDRSNYFNNSNDIIDG